MNDIVIFFTKPSACQMLTGELSEDMFTCALLSLVANSSNLYIVYWLTNMEYGDITVISQERYGVTNHRHYDCLLSILCSLTTKNTSKLHITGPLWGEFIGDRWTRFSNLEGVSMTWRHHVLLEWQIVYALTRVLLILVFEVRKKILRLRNFIKMPAVIHKPWDVYVRTVFEHKRDYVLIPNKCWLTYVFAVLDMVSYDTTYKGIVRFIWK